jgi:antitoxin Phd
MSEPARELAADGPAQPLASAVEDAEDAAEADVAFEEPGEDIPWDQVKAELGL